MGLHESLERGLYLVAREAGVGYDVAQGASAIERPKGFEYVGTGFCYGDAGQGRLFEGSSTRLAYTTG